MTSIHASMSYPEHLEEWVDAGVVERRHLRSAASLVTMAGVVGSVPDLAWVAFALVLAAPDAGHTCVDFGQIDLWADADEDLPATWSTKSEDWTAAVSSCPALVALPGAHTRTEREPFVLQGTLLYSARSLAEETAIAEKLNARIKAGTLQVLTGGPGSGKTTEVAKRIVNAVAQGSLGDRVALAAPTGLAAKRMARALTSAVASIDREDRAAGGPGLDDATFDTIEKLPKSTIHRLLRYNPAARVRWRHNADTPLDQSTVVIDEVSMMDLTMMSRLLDAVKPDATLMLVGDPHQLASVDAGTVLADLVRAAGDNAPWLTPKEGNFRFRVGSPVYDIAQATKNGDPGAVMEAVRHHHDAHASTPGPHFAWVDPEKDTAELNALARSVAEHARHLCRMAAVATSEAEQKAVLAFRDSVQVVCAHRRGNLGVSGWNAAVERQLGKLGGGQWYAGRPVMVTANDPFTKLANGDIGVVCGTGANKTVVFGGAENIETIPIARMPHVETVHALTIHKSQGSEYAHTIVVLPIRASRIITRELLYTGMTRAKSSLTIVGTEDVITTAVNAQVRRATGLADLVNKK